MRRALHNSDDSAAHVSRSLAETDPLVREALDNETRRQRTQVELIASENIMSRAVREALGHEIGNKTLEGYPGNRFHGGGEYVDVVERLAIERARELFGAAYANVQPHSGTQANQAVFFVFLRPGDRILSLDLAAGGHLSHGAGANLSGRWFDAHHYGVDRASGLLDYDRIEAQAREVRPALLIAGGSAYPRTIDFERMAGIAEAVEARLLVDMAHIAGLVAAGAHASPLPHADIVTCTTTKTLRGPRGGLILARSDAFAKRLQSAVFPGVQGSLHSNVLAAKAVCLGEALRPEFRGYGRRVVENARTLAATLADRGGRARGRGDRHPHGSTRSRFGRHPRPPGRDRARPRRDHVEQEPRPLQPGEPFEVDRTAPRRLGRNDTRLGSRRHGSARRVHRRSPPRRGPLRARPRACAGRSQDRKACTWR